MDSKMKSFNTPIDDDNLILQFYKVVVSTTIFSFSGATEKALNQWKKDIGFTTDFRDLDRSLRAHNETNHFVLKRNDKQETYIGILLRHLRNAFCHNNIRKNADGSFSLQDYWLNKKKNKQEMTMFANIDADKLLSLLAELEHKKKQ